MGILEPEAKNLRDLRWKGRGLKWKRRREREGWPDRAKAESEGAKMVRDGEWGIIELDTSCRVRDIEM